MMRMIVGVTASVVLGAILGGVLAGILGAILGGIVGMAFFMLGSSIDDPVMHVEDAQGIERQPQEVLCVPRGQKAECVFLRDPKTGRFLDIVECSMFPKRDEIDCQKRCLKMMNDGGVMREHGSKLPEAVVT